MKTIAITQRLVENENYSETRDALDVKFSALFRELDVLPIPLPTYTDFATYLHELPLDGIVLSGGNDLAAVNPNSISADRDQFERGVLKMAIAAKIPVLGICRGMQLIAEYFGSTLKPVTSHVATEHAIVAVEGTSYYDLVSRIGATNSFHDYGIDTVGDGIVVLARSDDGEIEALSHREHRVLGHMWHPERGVGPRTAEVELIKYFFG